MKFKIISLIFSFLLIALLLSGCGEDEHPSGLLGEESDFYGIWQEKEGSGGFGIGDTIKLNSDKTCEFYWSPGGAIHHYGTWKRNLSNNNFDYHFVITLNEKDTVYNYDFFDNYKTLRLREINSDSYIIYYKQ